MTGGLSRVALWTGVKFVGIVAASQSWEAYLATNISVRIKNAGQAIEFFEGKDRDDTACRSLWVAVIHKAMKDMAYACSKDTQRQLTPSEREKLQRIYELDTPVEFFESPWFEEICRHLELSASRIRTEITTRFASASGPAILNR